MTPRAIAFLLLATACPALRAQQEPGEELFLKSDRRTFPVDVLTYPGDSAGLSRVDIYLEVPYHSLQFVNQGGFFRASYELIVAINDTSDRLITEKAWSGNVEVDSIQEVRTRRPGEIVQKSVNLPPGRYSFDVRVRDLETDRASASRLTITVADYASGKWKVSDAMLLKGIETEGGRRVITPNIAAAISDVSDSFFVFLKLYNDLGVDSGLVIVEVSDRAAVPVLTDTLPVRLGAGENSLLPPVRCSPLGVGEFTLRVRVLPVPGGNTGGGETPQFAETERSFSVRWIGAPIEVTDIDAAIDQMQYIMEKELIEEMKALPPGVKRDRWTAYWKGRDPTPVTDRNELMEEYYSRVAYANKHFGHYTTGWKTDMGMVYIIFGTPSNVERHPFEIDSKPYEVWTYYELNRQFVFVDATGFGDYRLQTPIWDVYQTRPR
ncbi:MAG TPA: GWxTD domain-containing protein [Bacteroidota bacterium]|nr:GWxTD domain-containing protein [Bacteroidota bacterium]